MHSWPFIVTLQIITIDVGSIFSVWLLFLWCFLAVLRYSSLIPYFFLIGPSNRS